MSKVATKKNNKKNNFEFIQKLPFIITTLVVLFIWTPAFDPINLTKATLLTALALPLLPLSFLLTTKNMRCNLQWLIPALLLILHICLQLFNQDLTVWRKTIGTFTRSSGGLILISFVLLMITVALLNYEKNLNYWRFTIYAISCLMIPYGILQISGNDPIEWNYKVSNKLLLTLGNPNFASALFGILGAALIPLFFERKLKKVNRFVALFLGLGNLILSLQTNSIQGPIAMLGGLIFVFLLLPSMLKARLSLKVLGIGTAITAGLFIVSLYFIAPTIFDRMFSYTFDLRKYYWAAALRMIEKSPFFGVGIDSYGENYRLLRGYEVTQAYSPFVYSNNAHNFFLQIGATLGIIALVFYVLIQIFVVKAILELILDKKRKTTPTEMGVIAAWVAFQLQNLVSVDQIGIQVLGWCLSGILLSSLCSSGKTISPAIELKATVAYGLVFIFACAISISTLNKDIKLKAAMQTAYDPNSIQSINERAEFIYVAAKELQGDATYVALAAENIYQTGQRELALKLALENVGNLPTSVEALSTALVLLENENRTAEAYELRKRMQKYDPFNWENLFVLAQSAQKLNYVQEAKTYYEQIIALPSSAARKLEAQNALANLS